MLPHEGVPGHQRRVHGAHIALLTGRINQLTEHLKANLKDHSSRRGLLQMVARRRKMLDYLKGTATDRYKVVLEKLNLRK